ncbi:unnamed protein product, partial [Mesorhabditis spiculigera]
MIFTTNLFVLIFATLIPKYSAGDPIEQFIRGLALQARQFGEKAMPLPSINNGGYPGNSLYNLDPKTAGAIGSLSEFLNTCPSPQFADLSGSWALIFASRQLLQTLFQDVNDAINRLMIGQAVPMRKTLGTLFRPEADIQCATVVMSNAGAFELAYQVDGVPKSIIGQIEVEPDQTIRWQFAPTVDAQFSVIFASQVAEPSNRDVVILGQVDTFPKCGNVMVLARTRALYPSIISRLSQGGYDTPANPTLPINCPMAANPIPFPPNPQSPIIRPISQFMPF